jgi:cyclomaltodextrinase / maltogenic alpha-amylase / neopullulanase
LKYANYKHIYLEYNRPFVFERFFENDRIFVAVNIFDNDETISLSAYNNSSFFDLLYGEHINNSHHIQMKPYSVRILKEDSL